MKALPGSLLKYKWTFVLVTAACWAVATGYYFLADPPWVSEAKLMVRYMIERDPLFDNEAPNKLELIMRREMDILTSRELAEKVAAEIGADRFAPDNGNTDAAFIMAAGLTVTNESGSNIISLIFRHAEAETARVTLDTLIKQYMIEQLEIHQAMPGRSAAWVEADSLITKQASNIGLIQEPTPGIQDVARCNQILVGLYAGGPVLGLLAVMIRPALSRRGLPGDGQTGD